MLTGEKLALSERSVRETTHTVLHTTAICDSPTDLAQTAFPCLTRDASIASAKGATAVEECRPARPRLATQHAEHVPGGVALQVGTAAWAARWLVGCMVKRILATWTI